MAYGPSLADVIGHAATYVAKIRKGAKPADLPVEQPTKFDLVINLKTAKAHGLTIPQSLLQRAHQVLEWSAGEGSAQASPLASSPRRSPWKRNRRPRSFE